MLPKVFEWARLIVLVAALILALCGEWRIGFAVMSAAVVLSGLIEQERRA